MVFTKGHVMSKETIEKLKEKRKGRKPALGMRHTEETKKKMSKNANRHNLGKHLSDSVKKILSNKAKERFKTPENNPNWKGGISKFYCIDCGNKISYYKKRCNPCYFKSDEKRLLVVGKNNPMYGVRGNAHPAWTGLASLNTSIRSCFKMRQWKSDIFTRDNFTCQDCGKRGGNIEAHHIKEFAIIINEYNIRCLEEALLCEELWNINNGSTLCRKCHKKTFRHNKKLAEPVK